MHSPEEKLRQHNLPITAQRLAVLRAISQFPHATADQIAELVRKELGAITRQSIYNILLVLTEKGLIRRIQPAESPALYEDRVGDNHHHLVCRSCGRTEDVDCAIGDSPCIKPHSQHGFKIDEAEVIYWGLCPACIKQQAQPISPP